MKVKGPIGAAIAVSLDARWRPVHPDAWMLPEPCDDYWPIVTEGHRQDLIDHFAQTLTSKLVERCFTFLRRCWFGTRCWPLCAQISVETFFRMKDGTLNMVCSRLFVLVTCDQLLTKRHKVWRRSPPARAVERSQKR